MHEIGVREVVQFAGLTFNWETLCMTWITMAIVLVIAFCSARVGCTEYRQRETGRTDKPPSRA